MHDHSSRLDSLAGSGLRMAVAAAASLLAVRGVARLSRRIEFRDRVVLITGGSRGLGLAMARRFASEGAKLVLCARDESDLEGARKELAGKLNARVLAIPCDVTDSSQVADAVARAVAGFGGIDVLINNAGIIDVGPLETMDAADYERALDIHLWGPIYFVESALAHLRRSNGGRIVNVTSIGGKLSVPHLLPYSASKFALVGFSEGLRAALLRERIHVTTAVPGLMRTGSPRNASFKGKHRAEYALFKLSDSLPIMSINADRAAEQIIEACRYGDAEIILTLPAKLASAFHGLFPGLTADLAGLVNWMLPGPGGIGNRRATGSRSESMFSENFLTSLTDEAARKNNQMDH